MTEFLRGRATNSLKLLDIHLTDRDWLIAGRPTILVGTTLSGAAPAMAWLHAGSETRIPFDALLCALGRSPNVSGYGLEALGVPLSASRTVETNDYLQTLYPNIYACGDVAGPYQFTHTAAHQAWYASVNALFGTVLLGGLLFRQSLLKYVFGEVYKLKPEGWLVLTVRWGIFFFVLAALNVRFRDVQFTMPLLTQLWLFATPVAYPASVVPEPSTCSTTTRSECLGTQYEVRLLTVFPGAPRTPRSWRFGRSHGPMAEMFWLPCRSTWVAPIITCRLP